MLVAALNEQQSAALELISMTIDRGFANTALYVEPLIGTAMEIVGAAFVATGH
jgi:hypothetical protein